MPINERARTVLSQIVTLHYRTCEPVGSTLISKTRIIPFSPATIRNIMGRLENKGYLQQPHTSAGRLPTDLGYRTYVNDITLNPATMDQTEINQFDARLHDAVSAPVALKTVADYIHERTNLMTFHLPFRHSGIKLKQIHFERLNARRMLVLWIARGGHTFQSLLDIDESVVSRPMMEKAENFFNQAFRGRNLMEIQRHLTSQGRAGSDEWDLLLAKTSVVVNALAADVERIDNLSFQGFSELLEMPEFQSVAHVKIVFELFEKQFKLEKLIRRALHQSQERLLFFIGTEMDDPDLESLTVILAKIRSREDWIGMVGALGPKRMPYLKALQLLSFADQRIAARAI